MKIVQLRGILCDIPIFRNILSNIVKKGTDLARDVGKNVLDKQRDRFNKECMTSSGITLTNNGIKDITEAIHSLEKRRISLNNYRNY